MRNLSIFLSVVFCACGGNNYEETSENPAEVKVNGILTNYEVNLFNQFLTENQRIDSTTIVQDMALKSYRLKDLITEKTVVFRFSELHCDVCIDQEIKKLNQYADKLEGRVLLLTTYNNARDFVVFRRINELKVPAYRLTSDLNLEIEKAYTPYLFVTDKSLRVQHTYVPDKLFPNVSDSFYEGFIHRYLK